MNGQRQVAGGRWRGWLEVGHRLETTVWRRSVAGGRWLQVLSGGGGMLRYSAVRIGSIGSVRGHRISDTNGSVSDAPRYAVKVLLKQP